jgi:hypothetical protein
VCFGGILILTLSVLRINDLATPILNGATEAPIKDKTFLYILVEAFISVFFFGTRILLTKYCSKVLSSIRFVQLNFVAELGCGLFAILIAQIRMIPPLNLLQNEANVIQINTLSSCFGVGAEFFLITAID